MRAPLCGLEGRRHGGGRASDSGGSWHRPYDGAKKGKEEATTPQLDLAGTRLWGAEGGLNVRAPGPGSRGEGGRPPTGRGGGRPRPPRRAGGQARRAEWGGGGSNGLWAEADPGPQGGGLGGGGGGGGLAGQQPAGGARGPAWPRLSGRGGKTETLGEAAAAPPPPPLIR